MRLTTIIQTHLLNTPLQVQSLPQVYLAIELAKRGHEIHLINGTTSPGLRRGVHCRFLDEAIGSNCSKSYKMNENRTLNIQENFTTNMLRYYTNR